MRLVAPEWYVIKKMKEMGRKGEFNTHIHAVIDETEKAYKVITFTMNTILIFWIPKSLVKEIDDKQFTETMMNVSYERAMNEIAVIRACCV